MRGKYQVVFLALLAVVLLIAPLGARAQTNMELNLQSGTGAGSNYTICDAGGGGGCVIPGGSVAGTDLNPAAGIIGFSQNVGLWDINSGTALGSPVEVLPLLLDLSSFDATSGAGAQKLTLQLTETGLTASGVVALMNSIGGTSSLAGTVVTTTAYVSSTNTLFCGQGCGTQVTTQSLTGRSFNGIATGSGLNGHGLYSLDLVITINSGGLADQTSFDSELSQIPEPATLSVLGAGLLALGTGLRKKLLRG